MARWEPMLDTLMRERAGGLLAYARLLAGDDAEDVLQDALVKAFSRGRRFPNVPMAEAYVRRTIPSVFIDRVRRAGAARRAHDKLREVPPHRPDSAEVLDVRAALARLSPRERACIVLRFYDDLTVPGIADRLGIAEGTVKRYLSDASARLAQELDTVADWRADPTTVPVVAPQMKGAGR
ncbi:sigma-70 family RNA polymerase sigma factor [Demequina sp. NBRC 110057]|uniref:sigma-70 family RNA polymerase sigma factor n=1 Tax=Demequina sp. NBRC 110057 TaxID=1570346 RepID=UPI0009FCA77C|nr:sigma-70 family RNA polymerase sigma factor [Demequina sp. NBRC 110057]